MRRLSLAAVVALAPLTAGAQLTVYTDQAAWMNALAASGLIAHALPSTATEPTAFLCAVPGMTPATPGDNCGFAVGYEGNRFIATNRFGQIHDGLRSNPAEWPSVGVALAPGIAGIGFTYNPTVLRVTLGPDAGAPYTVGLDIVATFRDGTTATGIYPSFFLPADARTSAPLFIGVVADRPIASVGFNRMTLNDAVVDFSSPVVALVTAPEPASLALVATGLLAFGAVAYRRRGA